MTPETREKLKQALKDGTLSVNSVDPETGKVRRSPLKEVLRHHTPHKTLLKISLVCGREVTVTEDHSVFYPTGKGKEVVAAMASVLQVGDTLVIVTEDGEEISTSVVTDLTQVPAEEYTYDLSVPGDENFVISNGILAHNSYSIGGVSLDLEKSSKYEGLKSNAESQTQEMAEAKARTYKIIAGLQQPRFGRGVRSAWGPALGQGVMSPRNFL